MTPRRAVAVLALLCLTTSCLGVQHTVGGGPAGDERVQATNWYLVWGLFPLLRVDGRSLAGDATSYRIETYVAWDDALIFLVTLGLVTRQTIEVHR
ncbi:MAG: hypothetical protein R3F30_10140 [Planctomycetota bacterium]